MEAKIRDIETERDKRKIKERKINQEQKQSNN
jgi:hypothetical protein